MGLYTLVQVTRCRNRVMHCPALSRTKAGRTRRGGGGSADGWWTVGSVVGDIVGARLFLRTTSPTAMQRSRGEHTTGQINVGNRLVLRNA